MEGLTADDDVNHFRRRLNYWFTMIFIAELGIKLVGLGIKSNFSYYGFLKLFRLFQRYNEYF